MWNLDDNNIGSLGVKLLTKVEMTMLERLFLGSCRLGNEGVRHLAKGNWLHLKFLNICKNTLIQFRIIFTMMVMHQLGRVNGSKSMI
jgi:hypothetical protein